MSPSWEEPGREGADVEGELRDDMLIEWDVPIEMDDGVVLRADVFRPADVAGCPVLLSHGPYGKGLAFQDGYPEQWGILLGEHPEVGARSSGRYQGWEVADPETWVPEGYACVRVDSRGAGRSPGFLDPFSARETQDFYLCIEWAGTRSWSNGRVGLLGISYYAINQWLVAARQPPHLAAICPWEGAADWYRDMTHHGGILCTFWENWYRRQVMTVQHGLGRRGETSRATGQLVSGPETISERGLEESRAALGEDVRAHRLDGTYHRERSAEWEKVTVPLLSAANWGGQGLHARGNFEGFVRAASQEKWLEVHGLEHWTEFYTTYGLSLQRRFFDHFLKGEDNGWGDQPPVQLQVRTMDGFVERAEREWPIRRTRWMRLYLDPGRLSLRTAPLGEEASVSYRALGEGVTFWGAPLEEETEVTGPLAARLFVSGQDTDVDLFLVVRVFDPQGEEVVFQGALDPHTPVAQGWLRASQRRLDQDLSTAWRPYHRHDRVESLVPGETYQLEVEIWPTSIVMPAGYRLALSVRGRDYEHAGAGTGLATFANVMRGCGPFLHDDPEDRSPPAVGGEVTLHSGGGRDAYLLLPVVP